MPKYENTTPEWLATTNIIEPEQPTQRLALTILPRVKSSRKSHQGRYYTLLDCQRKEELDSQEVLKSKYVLEYDLLEARGVFISTTYFGNLE